MTVLSLAAVMLNPKRIVRPLFRTVEGIGTGETGEIDELGGAHQ